MKAIAIDDEPLALEVVNAHAAKVPFLELKGCFTDAFKALEYLQKEEIDLLFLDIKMPDISGIEFFKSLHKKPLLIFTTAYAEHAATSYEMDTVDYLLKPFSLARFTKACSKAYELYSKRTESENPDYLYVKTGYEQVKVLLDDIQYLEAAGNYITFVVRGKKILSRSTVDEAMNLLPSGRFIRVHRSYIVAADKIDKLGRHQVTVGGEQIPVSEAYTRMLTKLFKK